MRKIDVQPPDTKAWKQWLKNCQKETEANIKATEQGEKISIESKLYRRKIVKDFFFNNRAPFYGKCAYCDCQIVGLQHGDVEHFRPKALTTDENDEPIYLKDQQGNVILDDNGKEKLHPGYYWLGYDWRNLIPSCAICNQASAGGIGKRNRFPVVGIHAQVPGDEIHEEPLLINPASNDEKDDPEQHLYVDVATGLMVSRSERGEMCIKVFGFNARDSLRDARNDARNLVRLLLLDIQNTLPLLFKPNQSAQQALKQLILYINQLIDFWEGKKSCTMAVRDTLRAENYSLEWLYEKRRWFQDALSKLEFEEMDSQN